MAEQEPKESYLATKYQSPRDEVLGELQDNGWSNASSGDVESPVGFFSRITNTEAELLELYQAFEEKFAEMSRYGLTPEQLLGNFLLITDTQGFVHVVVYPTQEALVEQFDLLEQAYDAWSES